jgi:hypothetical protein
MDGGQPVQVEVRAGYAPTSDFWHALERVVAAADWNTESDRCHFCLGGDPARHRPDCPITEVRTVLRIGQGEQEPGQDATIPDAPDPGDREAVQEQEGPGYDESELALLTSALDATQEDYKRAQAQATRFGPVVAAARNYLRHLINPTTDWPRVRESRLLLTEAIEKCDDA